MRDGSDADAMSVVEAIVRDFESIKPTVEAHASGMEEPVA
jgi:hypothetical protein